MKRLFRRILSIAVALCTATNVFAQAPEFTGYALLESQFLFPKEEPATTNLSASGFYTSFNWTSKNETLNIYVQNHWLSPETKELYTGLTNNCFNLLEMLQIDWTPTDWFTLSGGKICNYGGGVEGTYENWDIITPLASSVWTMMPCYQYGASVGFSALNSTLSLGVTTSPYEEKYFKTGKLGLNLALNGEYGPVRLYWSSDWFQNCFDSWTWLVCLGQEVVFDSFHIGFDWFNKVGNNGELEEDSEDDPLLLNGNTFLLHLGCQPCEKFTIEGRLGLETHRGLNDWFGGAEFGWLPAEGIKLHLTGGWDNFSKAPFLKAGILVNFNFF